MYKKIFLILFLSLSTYANETIGASLKDLGKKVFGFSKMKDFNHKCLKITTKGN